jgi:hypothetical protein
MGYRLLLQKPLPPQPKPRVREREAIAILPGDQMENQMKDGCSFS